MISKNVVKFQSHNIEECRIYSLINEKIEISIQGIAKRDKSHLDLIFQS